MISLKYAWYHIAVCTIANMLLTGCANNEPNAPISPVNSSYSNNLTPAKNVLQRTPRAVTLVKKNAHNCLNKFSNKSIIRNRNYESIRKGSYYGSTYHVKRGDTLFYIAWITGNNYQDLAKINNILEPYSINVGQILQIRKKTASITENMLVSNALKTDSNQSSTEILSAPTFKVNTKQMTSRFSNRDSIFLKSFYKRNVNSISLSSNKKTLPIANNADSRNASTPAFNALLAATKDDNTKIIHWRWPTDGKIIDNFSTAEGGNKGVDISGSKGQLILATANGKVVYAGNALKGYGNLIIIKHNNDYLSAYAHNDTMFVREKQKVRIGQKIATMGNTGSDTTRLHFEIRYKGKSVNPLFYLPQR